MGQEHVHKQGDGGEHKGWEAPSDFEVVKELNANAGRLATALGFLPAAASNSLSTGPLHFADTTISAAPGLKSDGVYAALALVGVGLLFSVTALGSAMQPTIPDRPQEHVRWTDLIARKTALSEAADYLIFGCCVGLIAAWSLIVSFSLTGLPDICMWVIGGLCLLAAAIGVVLGSCKTVEAHFASGRRYWKHKSSSTS
jgi:hypothetical protein